nr:primosomal protein N' [Leptotrichiaceae bacterium]
SNEENKLEEKVKLFYNILEMKIKRVINIKENEMISEPFKAPIYKINGRFRYQIFIKFNRDSITKIKNILRKTADEYKEKGIRVSLDVDPINLM